MSVTSETAALQCLSPEQAWHYQALPLALTGNRLAVALPEGHPVGVAGELGLLTGRDIEVRVLGSAELTEALARHYRRDGESRTRSAVEGDFLGEVFAEARRMRASDIHLEPQREAARVRLRVDGVLLERYEVPLDRYPRYVNQVKVRAGLDISQRMLPQDGRIQLPAGGEGDVGLDVRVSTLPTLHGEKVVMRLLGSSAVELDLDRLGMTGAQLTDFRRGIGAEVGIVIVSGPTGSGKTTTLYGALNELNTVGVNITTLEDPIEYTLPGVNQVQTNEAVGFTFDRALATFMRQDPNIIMLGEIRDGESARVATRASLTGHLVLATLHTNSALGIVARLVDMGIPAFKLADTLNTLVAQRLVRRLCSACKRPVAGGVPPVPALRGAAIMEPRGCPECHYTGYIGRAAVHEVIRVDSELRAAIRASGLAEYQTTRGGETLRTRALALVADGTTSLAEARPLLADD